MAEGPLAGLGGGAAQQRPTEGRGVFTARSVPTEVAVASRRVSGGRSPTLAGADVPKLARGTPLRTRSINRSAGAMPRSLAQRTMMLCRTWRAHALRRHRRIVDSGETI